MIEQIEQLNASQVIELHEVCSKLMSYQIGNVGMNWLLVLDRDIGIKKIFKWAGFITHLIDEDFRDHAFKEKAQQLSRLIQDRFASIGLDISLWSPIFFYLGMIATIAKLIGFIRIEHHMSAKKLDAISRIDNRFGKLLLRDDNSDVIFITSEVQDPFDILDQLLSTEVLPVKQVDIFKAFVTDSTVDLLQNHKIPVRVHQYSHFIEQQRPNLEHIKFLFY